MDGHEGYRVNSLRRGALIWSTILIAFITAMVVAAARHVAIVEINKLLDNELQQIAGCVAHRMSGALQVLDRAARQKDAEFQLVSRRSTDCFLPPGAVFRIDAQQQFFPSRPAVFRIQAVDAIPLLGQMHGFSRRDAPGPTAGMRELLNRRW